MSSSKPGKEFEGQCLESESRKADPEKEVRMHRACHEYPFETHLGGEDHKKAEGEVGL